ncbi:PspC domain-containing protein [Hymenobacter busanensis]|uniref:PspC domain-containing protein n=1 Tax=Hymenobacter busanensis TaxID=2607656 RepID=A0A7L4ZSW3_9BACT|nr:PspC domain-containing protein [Hymenobacter busanensis]KAA9327198.1 PspC domain-containing protein [Hymenobacter busanensis]QHJ05865.1 PspC domain-containing protein [Hymenobacter busanensis]
MKKNISINLQGLIFHIEEDGYEVLQRYLQDVKAHFNTYRGHEEIVADIESRIAELFAARLSSTKQVITLEDVDAMVAKMGRVQEFQQDGSLDDDEDVADVNNYGRPVGAGPAAQAAGSGYQANATTAPDAEPRRLYRDMANRKIAGVCAGLARYFGIEALWVRLIFLIGLIALPILFDNIGADHLQEHFAGWTFLTYVILWIALPKRYDGAPESDQDPTFKKLFRDTDNGKIGGVSAGLAAYFHLDVVLVRILFIVFVFAGGFAIPLYIVLWILVPEAKTVGDKMRMRGDAMTLSSLDETARNNAFEAGYPGTATANRPVGTFLEELARNLRPLVNVIGSLIRWFAAALLIVIGFSLLVGLAVLAGVALGLIPESNTVMLGDAPAYTVLAGVPWWMIVSGFLAAGIPVLLMLLLGIGLVTRRSIVSRTVGLSLLGLWLLGVVGSVMGGVRISHDFQEEGTYSAERTLGPVNYSTVLLRTHELGSDWDLRPGITLAATDSGSAIRLSEEYSAHGATEAAAAATARTTMQYGASVRDSSVVLDDQFRYKPGAIFRGQGLDLTLRLPRDKQYRLTNDFAYFLDEDNFYNNRRPDNPEKHLYRLVGNQLACTDCTPDEMEARTDGDEDSEGDFDVNVNGERVHISLGDEDDNVDFSTSAEEYGSERRTFTEQDFDRIGVSGAYRVVVRYGAQYSVRAAGNERALKDLEVRRSGDDLLIRSRRRAFFGNWKNSDTDRVLIEVEMPTLTAVDLSGAVRAKVEGFTNLDDLRVEQSGASHLQFDGTCQALIMDLSGACHSRLEGQANTLRLEGSGACQVQAADFPVETANVDLTGVSKARLNVKQKLDAEVSGASEVRYSGNPTSVRADDSGAGHVRRVEAE